MKRVTSPAQMQAHVQAWQQSGLSQKEYCRQHQLASHLLAYWIRRVRQKNAPQAKGFVAVSLSTSATPVMELLTSSGAEPLVLHPPRGGLPAGALVLMLSLSAACRYYFYRGMTDFRRGFDGLSGLVRSELGHDPLEGDIFIFLNRKRNQVKLLHFEGDGFALYHKRLEEGTYQLPPA